MEFTPDKTDNLEENNLEQEFPEAQLVAKFGVPLPEGIDIATKEQIIKAIKTVEDPEIMINVYDMGLIYKIDIAENGNVDIDMTLTAPGCPVAGDMPSDVAFAVSTLDGAGEVTVNLVWEPQWTPERMTEEARMMLDIF